MYTAFVSISHDLPILKEILKLNQIMIRISIKMHSKAGSYLLVI